MATTLQPARPARAAGRAVTWQQAVVAAALAALMLISLVIATTAAAEPSPLVGSARLAFPDWLAGPLPGIGGALPIEAAGALLGVMLVAYVAVIALARVVSSRWILGTIVALHVVFMLAPPLLSTDVFGYLAFARLWELYGLNPYTHVVNEIPADAVNTYLGRSWPKKLESPYGPFLLLGSPALAAAGLAAGLWMLKATAAAAALGCVALVWSAARRLGLDATKAAAFVGLNPLWLAWTVGGAHNDLVMMLLAVAGLHLLITGWDRLGPAVVVVAVAVKATAGLLLVFMLLGSRRPRRSTLAAAAAAVLSAGAAFAIFGTALFQYPLTLIEQGTAASRQSVPRDISRLFGSETVLPAIDIAASVAFLAALAAIVVAAIRRRSEWLAYAGWATFALLLTTTWLHVWYIAGLLPLAALAGNRRLEVATVALSGLMIVIQLTR